jgi:hypothetical protein
MPRQNRVNPFGDIHAVPNHGMYMGNRGELHDRSGAIIRPWKIKHWIICMTEFRERSVPLAEPGRYTPLFFLDEATALAAGHRPCATCRRQAYKEFVAAFAAGNPQVFDDRKPSRDPMDRMLHGHRCSDGQQLTWTSTLAALPDGVMFTTDADIDQPLLKFDGHCLAWSFGGYQSVVDVSDAQVVNVLTPMPTVHAIDAGYIPTVHPSAQPVQ